IVFSTDKCKRPTDDTRNKITYVYPKYELLAVSSDRLSLLSSRQKQDDGRRATSINLQQSAILRWNLVARDSWTVCIFCACCMQNISLAKPPDFSRNQL